ncbi:hypothetical protein PCE1_000571 [Barthelona sp. PCE]
MSENANTFHRITVGQVVVEFPFKPYPQQEEFIQSLVTGVSRGHHVALESPTGTGKTLCVLSSLLAVQDSLARRDNIPRRVDKVDSSVYNHKIPVKIVFAARTHTQLDQTIKELSKLPYSPSVCVLASKKRMCINSNVPKRSEYTINQFCNVNNCNFFRGTVQARSLTPMSCTDIEDMKTQCREEGMCPYYFSQSVFGNTDLVLSPYNYLLRSESEIMTNSIVVIDEAHNFEDTCISNESIVIYSAYTQAAAAILSDDRFTKSEDKKEFVLQLIKFLMVLYIEIQNIEIPKGKNFVLLPPEAFMEMFAKCGLSISQFEIFADTIRGFMQGHLGEQVALNDIGAVFLEQLSDFLRKFEKTHELLSDAFKIVVMEPDHADREKGRLLKLWCFAPSVALHRLGILQSKNTHLVLISGTLGNFDVLESSYNLKFRTQFRASHVVPKNQFGVSVVSNPVLRGVYANRNKPEYLNALLDNVINIDKRGRGGILFFFPSYAFLEVFKKFAAKTLAGKSIPHMFDNSDDVASDFAGMILEHGRTTLFTVMRGRLSEGIDFKDELGRIAVIVGVPYVSLHDPYVNIRKQFLEERRRGLGAQWYQETAITAVNQACGRVLRHINDYAYIILLDQRYSNLTGRLSLWISQNIRTHTAAQMITDLNSWANDLPDFEQFSSFLSKVARRRVAAKHRRKQNEGLLAKKQVLRTSFSNASHPMHVGGSDISSRIKANLVKMGKERRNKQVMDFFRVRIPQTVIRDIFSLFRHCVQGKCSYGLLIIRLRAVLLSKDYEPALCHFISVLYADDRKSDILEIERLLPLSNHDLKKEVILHKRNLDQAAE